MIKDQNDYLKNWLFRANEDLAVIDSLYKTDPAFYASTICFHANRQWKSF